MAALAAVGPVSPRWVVSAVLAYGAWAGLFAWVGLTRGLVPLLVVGDLALTVALCLDNARLVPVDLIDDGSGWVAAAGSICVITLPLAWRAWRAIPAGLV